MSWSEGFEGNSKKEVVEKIDACKSAYFPKEARDVAKAVVNFATEPLATESLAFATHGHTHTAKEDPKGAARAEGKFHVWFIPRKA